MSRQTIHDELKGTHDIAKAAELLAADGDITYWQASYEGEHVQGDFDGTGDKLRSADHMNCFEFVHLLNVLTCCSDHPRNQGMSNLETQLLDVKAGFNEWDGRSPIPRGSVVVGTTPAFGSGSKGVYHVGVAVGNGQVVSNRNGQNVTKEPVGDVFGSMFYKVYYGPYPHCRCSESEDRSATSAAPIVPYGTTGPLHELPSVSAQNASRIGRGLIVVAFAAVLAGAGAVRFIFGSTPAEPTPLPTLPHATATVTAGAIGATGTTPSARVAVAPRAAPVVAVFDQQKFMTSYTVAVDDPGGVRYAVHWTGPNCGSWLPQTESASDAARSVWAMQWYHPHPPCAATTNHSDVLVTFTMTWDGGTLICVYEGSESGTGPSCKPL